MDYQKPVNDPKNKKKEILHVACVNEVLASKNFKRHTNMNTWKGFY